MSNPSARLLKDAADFGSVIEAMALENMAKMCLEMGIGELPDPIKELYMLAYQEGYGTASASALDGTNIIINGTVQRIKDGKNAN